MATSSTEPKSYDVILQGNAKKNIDLPIYREGNLPVAFEVHASRNSISDSKHYLVIRTREVENQVHACRMFDILLTLGMGFNFAIIVSLFLSDAYSNSKDGLTLTVTIALIGLMVYPFGMIGKRKFDPKILWAFNGVLTLLLGLRIALFFMVYTYWIDALIVLHVITIMCDVFLLANGIYFALTVKKYQELVALLDKKRTESIDFSVKVSDGVSEP